MEWVCIVIAINFDYTENNHLDVGVILRIGCLICWMGGGGVVKIVLAIREKFNLLLLYECWKSMLISSMVRAFSDRSENITGG